MKKLFLAIGLLLCTTAAHAQTSNVTATITDSDSQAWNNGTYTISFVQPTGNSQPPVWNGAPMTSAQKLFKGSLDASGVLSIALPDNGFITPTGSRWLFVICPNASAGCAQISLFVTGSSVDLSTTLSNATTAPRFPASPTSYGYLDIEVAPTPYPGGGYFNVSSQTLRTWNGSAWVTGGGGSSVGPGTPSNVGCFSTTSNVQNCTDPITDVAGLVTIPADLVVGRGGGAASVAYPSGATAGCQTPAAGFNILCSDGTNNTMDQSLNGAAYVPSATVVGTPTTGNCTSFAGIASVQDAGFPCANLPATAGAHTFFGNNTGSSGPLAATVPIGTNDLFPNIYCVTTGSADAYVATLPVVATALTAGVVVNINPNFTNATTAPTLNVSALGAKSILKTINGVLVNVVAGDIAANANAQLLYDGTQFQLLNPATTRSMWPCAAQAGLTDTVDGPTTSPTETLFTTVCKIPANTLVAGVVIDGSLGLDWTATATVPNSTIKMYLCPTQASLTGCHGLFTGTTSAASAGTFSTVLPFVIIGRAAAGAAAAISQQIAVGVGANTPWGRNTFSGNVSNIATNADQYIQISASFAANTAGNSYTIRSLIFR